MDVKLEHSTGGTSHEFKITKESMDKQSRTLQYLVSVGFNSNSNWLFRDKIFHLILPNEVWKICEVCTSQIYSD